MSRPTWRRTVELAGVRIFVDAIGGAGEHFDACYGGFVSQSEGREPDIRLQLDIDERHFAIAPASSASIRSSVGIIADDGSVRFDRGGFRLEFDPKRGIARAVASPLLLDLVTPLHLLLSYSLPSRNGFLIHSSGYGDSRGAVLFAGVSGSGKTTTARKLEHRNVLSDDQVAVRRVDGCWMAFALPFVGEYRRRPLPQMTPLKRILLLRKGVSGARISALHPAIAATRLLACVPWCVPGSEHMLVLLPLASEVAMNATVAEVTIGRDEPVLELIDRVLSEGSG